MEDKIIEKVDEKIKPILESGITISNIDNLYKLSKIKHMAKEDKEMYSGNYSGRRAGFDAYGRGSYGDGYGNYNDSYRDSYSRRGRDMKYRGEDKLETMHDEYGNYMEGRSRYGNSEETDKSFHYMVKALEDFIKVLYEEAETPQQKQMLRETLQRSI